MYWLSVGGNVTDVSNLHRKHIPNVSSKTSQGTRSDLRTGLEDGEDVETKEELERIILGYAKREGNHGVSVYMVSRIAVCSREWVRINMNRLAEEGLLRKRILGPQSFIFYITEEGARYIED